MLLLPEVDGGGGGERSPRRLDTPPTVAVTAGGAADGTLADPDMPTIGSYCPGCSRACSCAMKSKARCFRSVLSSLYMRRSGPSLSSLEAMGSEEKCTGGAICTFLTTCRFSRSDAASATIIEKTRRRAKISSFFSDANASCRALAEGSKISLLARRLSEQRSSVSD